MTSTSPFVQQEGAEVAKSVALTDLHRTATSNQVFPDPANFTFLPELYLVISRLSLLKSTTIGGSTFASQQSGDGLSQAIAIGGGNPLTITTSHESRASDVSGLSIKGGEVIDLKDLPAQVYTIRQALVRAKEIVRQLPDINRTTDEQEMEMMELERRIHALKERLSELGSIAGRNRETVVMEQMEL